MTDFIVVEIEQYALARGYCDIEYTVCRMKSGRTKTFEDGDPELEQFFHDRNSYWKSHGFKRAKVKGGWTLKPVKGAAS